MSTPRGPLKNGELVNSTTNRKLYNLGELKKMSNNDDTFIRQTLIIFLENSEEAIAGFRKSLHERNWKTAGELAHKILPSCRHLEIDSIVSSLIEIKSKTIIESRNDCMAQKIQETISILNDVITSMREEMADWEK
jgi:HPt (histidine-containing phosphotransfer) domain-containing protein